MSIDQYKSWVESNIDLVQGTSSVIQTSMLFIGFLFGLFYLRQHKAKVKLERAHDNAGQILRHIVELEDILEKIFHIQPSKEVSEKISSEVAPFDFPINDFLYRCHLMKYAYGAHREEFKQVLDDIKIKGMILSDDRLLKHIEEMTKAFLNIFERYSSFAKRLEIYNGEKDLSELPEIKKFEKEFNKTLPHEITDLEDKNKTELGVKNMMIYKRLKRHLG